MSGAGASSSPSLIDRLGLVQLALRTEKLAGWLLVVGPGRNRVAEQLLGLATAPSRRLFCWIPHEGFPTVVAHPLDQTIAGGLPGDTKLYRSWDELRQRLGRVLVAHDRIAMEHAPMGSHPYLSIVDAGTVELVRSYGAYVVSSGELSAQVLGPVEEVSLKAHEQAAVELDEVVRRWLRAIGDLGVGTSHGSCEALLREALFAANLHPLVVDLKLQTPRFEVDYDDWLAEEEPVLRKDQLLGLHVVARPTAGPPTTAELRRSASVGLPAADSLHDAYQALGHAMDTAATLVASRREGGLSIRGYEVDQAARDALQRAGLIRGVTHRLGHALGPVPCFGEVGLLDCSEAIETRPLLSHTAWAMTPTVRRHGAFVRASRNAFLGGSGGLKWTSQGPARLPVVTLKETD